MKRMKATDASRGFSDLLDEVEHRGEEVVIERHGRPVARVVPVGKESTVADLIEFLRTTPLPDDDFAGDVIGARRRMREAGLPKGSWES